MMAMFKPIRKNLTIVYILTFFLFLIFILAVMYVTVQKVAEREQAREIRQYMKQEAAISKSGIARLKGKPAEKVKEADHPYFYYIFKLDGTLLKGEELIPGFHTKMKKFVTEKSSPSGMYETEYKERHAMYHAGMRTVPGIGRVYTVIGIETTGAHLVLKKLLLLFLFLAAVFTGVLALLSYFLAGKAIVPIQQAFDKQRKFVSDASHELRTPVSVFYSSAELLEREEGENLSAFGRGIVADLKTEAKLMAAMLDDLLFLARSDQNVQPYRFEEVGLYDLCTSIARRFQSGLPEEILLVNNLQDCPVVWGDPTRLQELVYIFLENARQYTEKGFIKLSLYKRGSFAAIEIADSGIGIDAHDLPRIFERFYRGDKARVRDGTGLGLSIAETIAKKHGGRIEVESKPGEGTIFTIFIPLKEVHHG